MASSSTCSTPPSLPQPSVPPISPAKVSPEPPLPPLYQSSPPIPPGTPERALSQEHTPKIPQGLPNITPTPQQQSNLDEPSPAASRVVLGMFPMQQLLEPPHQSTLVHPRPSTPAPVPAQPKPSALPPPPAGDVVPSAIANEKQMKGKKRQNQPQTSGPSRFSSRNSKPPSKIGPLKNTAVTK